MSDIYLVDDHAMMRDGLRAVLAAAGHQVVGECDGPSQALADIQRLAPAVLLLDINLGAHSGLDLLAELQRANLGVHSIVLSMSAQPRHVAEALRLGAAGYVLKGAGADELLAAISSVQRGRRYLGAHIADLALRGQTEPDSDQALASLSARERQVIALVVRGHSSAEIGAQLQLSPKTVDSYRSRLMAKVGAADVTALVRLAIRSGLVDASD
jgi:two-component system, NarL family, invasion response regulator UvrY